MVNIFDDAFTSSTYSSHCVGHVDDKGYIFDDAYTSSTYSSHCIGHVDDKGYIFDDAYTSSTYSSHCIGHVDNKGYIFNKPYESSTYSAHCVGHADGADILHSGGAALLLMLRHGSGTGQPVDSPQSRQTAPTAEPTSSFYSGRNSGMDFFIVILIIVAGIFGIKHLQASLPVFFSLIFFMYAANTLISKAFIKNQTCEFKLWHMLGHIALSVVIGFVVIVVWVFVAEVLLRKFTFPVREALEESILIAGYIAGIGTFAMSFGFYYIEPRGKLLWLKSIIVIILCALIAKYCTGIPQLIIALCVELAVWAFICYCTRGAGTPRPIKPTRTKPMSVAAVLPVSQTETRSIFECTHKNCGTKCSIPKHKGIVKITCPNCGNKFSADDR